ncbi:AraC family transcriptional regulator [Bermanella marisrubri]|uniref:AraC-type DNA-binding domain-containing protein n=1 Tax=Bermanella marisrubri TaxID=207949 RepID=Q1N5F0_9GAMM|nr:AraC family transcriptional regulator [Bermanella marisrubri]EAT13106.1 AraC-type DNA-binding domain-containing protein [Oceanobacter sp. RED65] [Bermanella marisrubri]QIZ83884.1 AraC family transcriptional regulator [Bermanella marisrubri]
MQLQVAAFSVRTTLAYLIHHGVPQAPLFEIVGLNREQLDEPDRMVDVSIIEAIYDFGAQYLDCNNIGFRVGQWGDSGRWGVLGHIVDSASTIAQALEYQKRYQSLVGNVSRSEFLIENQYGVLKWLPHYQCSRHITEEVVTSWVAFAKKALAVKLSPHAIHFTHEQEADKSEFEVFFECPVYFSSTFTGIEFDTRIIEMPLMGHSPDLLKVLTGYADLIVLKKQKNAANEVVTQFVIDSLQHKVPTLQDVAEHLGVSARNLQRKFKQQGTNFKTIVDDIRKEYAFTYLLQTNYKMTYIAQILGFSEQSVFQRAFKRWTGMTPGEYRIHHGVRDFNQDKL